MIIRFVASLGCLGLVTFLIIGQSTLSASGCRAVAVNHVVAIKDVVAVKQEIVPVAVPLAFPVIAVPVYSYVNTAPVSVYNQHQNQAQLSADQIADLVMKRIEAKWGAGNGPPAINKTGANPPNINNNAVITLLTNKCASCHSGQATAGGHFAMFNEQKQLLNLPRDTKWDIFNQVHEGLMPKGKEPLPDVEVDLIRKWAKQK